VKTVLLVEDSPDDIFIIKTACMRSGFPLLLKVVNDGQAAIDYLAGQDIYADRAQFPLPDLIFLDIKLPKRNGHEVLEWIRNCAELKYLPVIMLTGSMEPSDVERAYKLGVTSYLSKQANIVGFAQGVRIILKYWFELNVKPG
jgi:CheY-like chemotaxis protein